jgi:16S rRNA G966 N2-methylase RsmD
MEHDKENFVNRIWVDRVNQTLEFPIDRPTIDAAIQDFDNLKSKSFTYLLKKGEWFSRYEYKYPFNDIYIDLDNTGIKSSDHYSFDSRMSCNSINSPSPYRVWNTEKFFKSMASALISLKLYEPTKQNLKTCLALRKYIASQFRASAAKCIYEAFEGKDILDFSSGWGDRLAAFMATDGASSYTGIDPNDSLHDGYQAQINQFNSGKSVEMNNACAEEFEHTRKYDLVFTSPPYFNIEKYSECENQSFKKYKKIDVWLNEFLFKAINGFWGNLKESAVVMINISDVYSNHTVNRICDPMNDYIATLPNAKYLGCIGYRMQKRIGSKSSKKGTFGEPVWIWTNDPTLTLDGVLGKYFEDQQIN